MKLEQQVTSLEISKRLKELGVKQESLFEYAVDPTDSKVFNIYRTTPISATKEYTFMHKVFSAFTVAELGEMLPSPFQTWQEGGGWVFDFIGKQLSIGFPTKSEADARGAMLIYLIENKLI